LRSQSTVDDVDGRRRRLETQLGNARTLFELGDIPKAEYLERRGRLQRSLEGLKSDTEVGTTLDRAAAYLKDLPAAWHAASDAQRNALARLLYEEVHIRDEWVAAVKPQPTFAAFFNLDCQMRRLSSGSDGGWSRNCTLPTGAVIVAEPPERQPVGISRRSSYQQPRHRKLTPDQLAAIRQRPHHTLRELAEEYDVSHETIRAVRSRKTPRFDGR